MTVLAFTADLHVEPQGTRIDPETGLNARLLDYLRTTSRIAVDARRNNAGALIVAGDFTERRHPAPWIVGRIRDALTLGPTRQVYLRGNHDGELGGHSIVTVLAETGGPKTAITRPRLEFINADVVLACIPYLDRHWLRAQPGFETVPDADVFRVLGEQFVSIAAGLYAEARATWPGSAAVLVCHQTMRGAAMSDAQAAFLGDQQTLVDAAAVQAMGWEGVVAGHLHRHQTVVEARRRSGRLIGGGPVLYTGSIERVDFGEEHDAKGYVLAEVGPGYFDWTFVEVPARRYVTLDCAALEEGPADALVEDAIVRVLNVPPEDDAADVRRAIEQRGAFAVTEIRRAAATAPTAAGGLAEGLTPSEALEAYFAGEEDRAPLVELGRGVLAEVAG